MNTADINKPSSPESERTLLAAIVEGKAAEVFATEITEQWFLNDRNQSVFVAAKKLYDTGSEVSEIPVATQFNVEISKFTSEDQDDSDYFISQLPYGNVEEWLPAFNIAKAKAYQRDTIRRVRKLLEAAQEPQSFIEGLAEAISEPMEDLMTLTLSDNGEDAIERIEAFIQTQRDEAAGKVERVPHEFRLFTGMPKLEELVGQIDTRLRDNNLIIGAPSSTGKSALMRQMIIENLRQHEDWVAVGFLLESSVDDWWKNAARSLAGIDTRQPLTTVKAVNLKAYWEHLAWLKSITNVGLFLYDSPKSVELIGAKCNEIKAKSGRLDLIVTDYVQILERDRRGSNEAEVAAISRSLQQLQKRFRCPHVAGSQLNEDGKVRESRSIYNDATICWILDRPDNDRRGNKQVEGLSNYYTTLHQSKSRNGAKITAGFDFNVTTQRMSDL